MFCLLGEKFELCSKADPESGRCVLTNPAVEFSPSANWSYFVTTPFGKTVCTRGKREGCDNLPVWVIYMYS